jgi:hypothetical protein
MVVLPQLKRGSMLEKIDGGTNKRFCTSCQLMRPAEYGKMITSGKINRWKCTACIEKRSTPPYAKKKGEGDA